MMKECSIINKPFKVIFILNFMLKRIWNYIKNAKAKEAEEEIKKQIEFSKLDKYMSLLMREKLGSFNREINDKIIEIKEKQEIILHNLRTFHKKSLMNSNISQREIQIMDGNRDQYIKKISHFATNLDIPKDYLEMYDYSIQFSEKLEQLGKELQKNTFVLSHFFENEIREINKELHDIEKSIINIRIEFEKNNIKDFKDIQEKIKEIKLHKNKIFDIQKQINEQQELKQGFDDKLKKLNERVDTITSGTDYKTLQSFKEEKELIETDIKYEFKELEELFSEIETALKKYAYKNPDKKIIKNYLENMQDTFLADSGLEISQIITDILPLVENETLELKDKKKETTINALNRLVFSFLKNKHATISKLNASLKELNMKIMHNSSSLNISENQYWMNHTEEKIQQHKSLIDKLSKEIDKIEEYNHSAKQEIEADLEHLGHKMDLIDDYDGEETKEEEAVADY